MTTEWTDADDALAQLDSLPDDHPVTLTHAFFHALEDPEENREFLTQIVTPESVPAWGDFEIAARLIEFDFSISNSARIYPSAPDVAYVILLEHQPHPGIIRDRQIAPTLIPAWVWRPDLKGWKLHNITPAPGTPPEHLPRTSPGTAPSINAQPLRHAV